MSTRELDNFYFPCSCCSGFATIEPTLREPFHSQDLNMNNSLCHSPYAPYNSEPVNSPTDQLADRPTRRRQLADV